MNHLLYNFSVIMIILGIIILTNSISVANTIANYKPVKKLYKENIKIKKDYPTKVFDKMFDSPSVWMGYSDFDSKEFEYKSDI